MKLKNLDDILLAANECVNSMYQLTTDEKNPDFLIESANKVGLKYMDKLCLKASKLITNTEEDINIFYKISKLRTVATFISKGFLDEYNK